MKKWTALLVFLISVLNQFGYGQTHKWAFDINSSASGLAIIRVQTVDDSSNVYIGGSFRDSLYIGTDTFYFPSSTQQTIFIAKYKADGQYIWGKSFTNVSSANLADIVINSKGQIILYGHYSLGSGASISFGSYSLTKQSAVFLAFLNSSGTFTDARDIAYGFYTTANKIVLGKDDAIHTTYYLNGFGGKWTINDASSPVSGTGYPSVIAKYSKDGKDLKWYKKYDINDVSGLAGLAVDRFSQVYYSFRAVANKTILGVSTGSTSMVFLVWLRADGSVKDKLTSSNTNIFASIDHIAAFDSSSIYFGGNTRGYSLTFAGTTIKSLSSYPTRVFYFVGELKNFDSIGWVRSTSHSYSSLAGLSRFSVNGDFLYFSSVHNSSGFSFSGFSTSSYVASVVSKFDRLGNLLWYLPLNSSSPPILTAFGSQDLLYSGGYQSQIDLNPFTLKNTRSTAKPFIARTFDYSITRGEVYPGPYCAGDSIRIPYEVSGDFDTSNVFYAELSDSKGEFFGDELELGRLKFNRDSTIVGRLPLFKVASSNKYRIRITSTKPVVQSYYKLDTLNLLIYSTDTADPGNDTTICYGDTLRLNTYGGTLWKWSPNYNISDSSSRTPLVYPLIDTTYQIIIDDSSGCGAPDTAEIKISITPSPIFTGKAYSDTVVCKDDVVKLIAQFDYGKPSYHVLWYNLGNQLLRKIETQQKSDTLSIAIKNNTSFYAVLTDSCSILTDTINFSVALFDTMKVISLPKDTIICRGSELSLSPKVSFVKMDSIDFQWQELSPIDQERGNDSVLVKSYAQNTSLLLTIQNRCLNQSITHKVEVKTHDAISSKIENNLTRDTLCFGETFRLLGTATGGNPAQSINFRWRLKDSIYNADSLIISTEFLKEWYPSDSVFSVEMIAGDGCTALEDTATYRFLILPKLKINQVQWFDTLLCLGTSTNNAITTVGGLDDKNHLVKWMFGGKNLNSGKSFTISADSFAPGSEHSILVVLADGCSISDTTSIKFSLPDLLSVNISSSEVLNGKICNNVPFNLNEQATGGNKNDHRFNWYLNNNQLDTLKVLKQLGADHDMFSDSIAQYYVEVSDGCNLPNARDTFTFHILAKPVISVTNDSVKRRQTVDTIICRGQQISFTAHAFYGNMLEQRISWLIDDDSVSEGNDFVFRQTDQDQSINSFELKAVLNDDCGRQKDTLTIQVKVREPLALGLPADTTICYGNGLSRKVAATGGQSAGYSFEWKDLSTGLSIGTTEEILLSNVTAEKNLQVVLKDGCSIQNDTGYVNIKVLQPLNVQLIGDSICYRDEAILTSNVVGGLTDKYRYTWYKNDLRLANNKNVLTLSVDSQTRVKVVVEDGCTAFGDSATYLLAPKPKFEVSNELSEICEPFKPSWSLNSLTKDAYTYTAFDVGNNIPRSLLDLVTYSSGDYAFVFVAENALGCRDSIFKSFRIKPKPSANFTWTPTTLDFENSTLTAVAEQKGLDRYDWTINNTAFGNEATASTQLNEVGFYTVILVVNQDECYDTVRNDIEFVDAYNYFGVTAFSPNGDGLNDVFKPNISGIQLVDYQIYNRWGECIYKGVGNSASWNGEVGDKPAPLGNYTVLIQARDLKGKNFYYVEHLKLLR